MRPLISHKIGNGLGTSLWFDNWLQLGPIVSIYGDRIIYDSGLPRNATVSSIIQNGNWVWPVANSPDLLILKSSIPEAMLPRSDQCDSICWTATLFGNFSTSSAWNKIRAHCAKVSWHKLVWFPGLIPKAAFILWLAIRQRLGTQDRLRTPISTGCLFCAGQLETHEHLFFECPASSHIWTMVLAKSAISHNIIKWQDYIEWLVIQWNSKSLPIRILKLCFQATVYVIWQERNERFHTNSIRDTNTLYRSIITMVRIKLLSLTGISHTLHNRQAQQQWDLPESVFV